MNWKLQGGKSSSRTRELTSGRENRAQAGREATAEPAMEAARAENRAPGRANHPPSE
jgi:hypothetical protein